MKPTAQDVIDILYEHEFISNNKTMPIRKATHGECCTCQDCGYYHDECICGDNEVIAGIYDLFGEAQDGD